MNSENRSKHQSYIFFLSEDGQILFMPTSTYAALVRGETTLHEYAGRQIRVADLYVALQENTPTDIQNETYSFVSFDESGRADPHHGSFSLEQNNDFYQAALHSRYDDIYCDPEIRELRNKISDEFSWLPTNEERERMHVMIFASHSFPE